MVQKWLYTPLSQSASAIEYTDCISAEGYDEGPDMTLNH